MSPAPSGDVLSRWQRPPRCNLAVGAPCPTGADDLAQAIRHLARDITRTLSALGLT